MCLAGASTEVGGPGALTRAGSFVDGTGAGALAVVGGRRPSLAFSFVGLRCAADNLAPLPAEVDSAVGVSRSGTVAVLTWNPAADSTASLVLRGHPSRLILEKLGSEDTVVLVDDFVGTGDTVNRTMMPLGGYRLPRRCVNMASSNSAGFMGPLPKRREPRAVTLWARSS